MIDFKKEDVLAMETIPREDATPMAFTVRLKDGTRRTFRVEQLDDEGRRFFGIDVPR